MRGGHLGEAAARMRMAVGFRLLVTIAAVVVTIDAMTKMLVVGLLDPGQSFPILGESVICTVVRSTSPAWMTGDKYTWALTVADAAVAVCILWWGRGLSSLLWAAGLGLLLGGALGNLLDRLFRAPGALRGAVIDFVMIDRLPVFNFADAAVVGAVALLLSLSLTRIQAT